MPASRPFTNLQETDCNDGFTWHCPLDSQQIAEILNRIEDETQLTWAACIAQLFAGKELSTPKHRWRLLRLQ